MLQVAVFKAPDATSPLSETNRFTVTIYHEDGTWTARPITLAESVEFAMLAGRGASDPADVIRLQPKTPGADIGPENPLVLFTYIIPENSLSIASWIDRRVLKPATLALQKTDNQIPDTLEG